MFRLKITLTHVVLVGLLIGSVHILMNGRMMKEVDHQTEVSVRRAAVIAEQTKRFDHFALMEKGRMIAQDKDTHDFLSLDREKLLAKINEENSWILEGDVKKKLGDEAKKAAESDDQQLSTSDLRHLAVDFRLRVAHKRFENIAKGFDETKRNLEQDLMERQPIEPDMVMALNKNGVGVAALGKDRYSWGASSNSMNVVEKYSVVQDVLDNPDKGAVLDVWEWAWGPGDDPSLYQVAVVPVRPHGGVDPAGAVVVGYTIHDGAAQEIRRLVGGVTTGKEEGAQHVEQEDIEAAPEVAFFHGQSIHSSTFDSTRQKRLDKRLFEEVKILESDDPEKEIHLELDGKPFTGFVRFFPGQFNAEKPTGIVVLSDLGEARAPVESIVQRVDLIGLIVIVLGLGLLLLFYQRFIKPAAEIEETIGEILSGHKDAEFVISQDHQIFSSLAQGLNLMSAYLQGKPMPDDEAELEGWGDLVGGGGGGGGGESGGKAPEVTGVQMPGMGGGGGGSESSEDDDNDKSQG